MLDLDQDIAPIPRSREENQERAFIAASRRKDRSLDARLESANRASMLHKKRTGKAFHITKEIVEKEAMYEEVDERYQEKRIRMLQQQNKQIEEQFNRHLLAALAARSYSNGSSIQNRRSSHMTPRPSIDGSRKMSLDLSNIRSSFSQGSGPLASPMTTEGYVLSPSASYDANAPSYMPMSGPETPYTMTASGTGIPAYVGQQTPVWNTPVPWMQQTGPTPTDAHAVQMWQQQMMQAQMPDTALQMRQFRDRLASAPELPQHAPLPPGPTGPGHSRGQSQPSNNYNLHLLTQTTNLLPASPKIEALSAGTHSTPDFCPTPNTPSPTATMHAMDGKEDGLMVSHEEMDPDFTDFSQFALHLGNSTVPDRESFGFDDFIGDEFTSVSC